MFTYYQLLMHDFASIAMPPVLVSISARRSHGQIVSHPSSFSPFGSDSPRMSSLVSNIYVRKRQPHLKCMLHNCVFFNVASIRKIMLLSRCARRMCRTQAHSSMGQVYPEMLISRSDGSRCSLKARNSAGKNFRERDMTSLVL